jgi:hypothetical protein
MTMTPRRLQALLLFMLMVVVAIGVGGADIARALFGLVVVLGGMLLLYYFLMGVFGDG